MQSAHLTSSHTNVEDKSSPTSNNHVTALSGSNEADENHGSPVNEGSKEADENQGSPVSEKIESGLCLVPMDRIMHVANENLKDCELCKKGHPLKLQLDRRIGFAIDWILACK